jgi:hypothetical protein
MVAVAGNAHGFRGYEPRVTLFTSPHENNNTVVNIPFNKNHLYDNRTMLHCAPMGDEHRHEQEHVIRFDRGQLKELIATANKLIDLFAAKDQAIINRLTQKLKQSNDSVQKAEQANEGDL